MASQEAVVSLLTQVCASRTTHLQQTTNPLFHLIFIAHSLSLPSRHPSLPSLEEAEGKQTYLKKDRVSEVLVFPQPSSVLRFSHPSIEAIWRDMWTTAITMAKESRYLTWSFVD